MFTSVSLMSLLRSLVLDLDLDLDLELELGFRIGIGIVWVDVGYLDIATA
ncbi:hypothetical protein BSPWISOXPB_956 [uncultured Gammaproteobacteria bacterium]|nr:hypothetical protein BSPWISOXPB_956 [uncultured Gammaproteobacteria bacterium]